MREVYWDTDCEDYDEINDINDFCTPPPQYCTQGAVNIVNMVGDLEKIAVIPGESSLTKFHDLDKCWALIKETDIFWSDDDSEGEEDEIVSGNNSLPTQEIVDPNQVSCGSGVTPVLSSPSTPSFLSSSLQSAQ